MNIVIGIPVYNEENNIAKIILNLKCTNYKILICDDGSDDFSKEIAKSLGVEVISHEKNLGYGESIKTIFKKCKQIDCDILVTFDGDGQHQIKDIKNVIAPIINKESDIVIGSRFLGNEKHVPKYRELGIKTINKVTNLTSGTKVTDSQSGFRAYSKKVIEKINLSESGMGISTEILIKAKNNNFIISEVPVEIKYEGKTSKHNPVSHGTSVILSTVKMVAMKRPLTFYGIPGAIFLIIGMIFISWSITAFIDSGKLITNITIIAATTTILGAILILTSTILHTIVTLNKESKKNGT